MKTVSHYKNQVALLLDVLPAINDVPCFALKGGTAINLFVQNMPRLSVDIDLTYLPIEPREIFLTNFQESLEQLKKTVLERGKGAYKVDGLFTSKDKHLTKLLVRSAEVEVKIEPNIIFRGGVFKTEKLTLCEAAQNEFLRSIKINTVSKADLYAGKLCAALNRQHPRDLFDVKMLFEQGKITDELRKAFVVHLACDARPMSELLKPNKLELSSVFEKEFSGMTMRPITLEELIAARELLFSTINTMLTENERKFLLSVGQGNPEWSLMDMNLSELPALQWKLINIKKMDKTKHQVALEKLKRVLEL